MVVEEQRLVVRWGLAVVTEPCCLDKADFADQVIEDCSGSVVLLEPGVMN